MNAIVFEWCEIVIRGQKALPLHLIACEKKAKKHAHKNVLLDQHVDCGMPPSEKHKHTFASVD